MMSFTKKHCGSSLSSWLIVDTLFISMLFTPFVPTCNHFRLYIGYLGEQNSGFSAFLQMTSLLKGSILQVPRGLLVLLFDTSLAHIGAKALDPKHSIDYLQHHPSPSPPLPPSPFPLPSFPFPLPPSPNEAMDSCPYYAINSGADPGFCEGGFERGFVDSLKGTFEQK